LSDGDLERLPVDALVVLRVMLVAELQGALLTSLLIKSLEDGVGRVVAGYDLDGALAGGGAVLVDDLFVNVGLCGFELE